MSFTELYNGSITREEDFSRLILYFFHSNSLIKKTARIGRQGVQKGEDFETTYFMDGPI